MRATIVPDSGIGSATLYKDFTDKPDKVRCDFDLKLDQFPSNGEVHVMQLVTSASGMQDYHLDFATKAGSWRIAEYQPLAGGGAIDRSEALTGLLPTGTWLHVTFDVTPSSATVTANGSTVTLGSITPPAGGSKRTLNVGVPFATANVQSAQVFIDNIDCTMGR